MTGFRSNKSNDCMTTMKTIERAEGSGKAVKIESNRLNVGQPIQDSTQKYQVSNKSNSERVAPQHHPCTDCDGHVNDHSFVHVKCDDDDTFLRVCKELMTCR